MMRHPQYACALGMTLFAYDLWPAAPGAVRYSGRVTEIASRPAELVALDAVLGGIADHVDRPTVTSRARLRDVLAAYVDATGLDGLQLRIEPPHRRRDHRGRREPPARRRRRG